MLLSELFETNIMERSAQDRIIGAVTDFYRKNTKLTKPEDFDKQSEELLDKAPANLRSKISDILAKAKGNPYLQGGVITTVGSLLAGGVLSSASHFHLSPGQTNIVLQAILNTVIPTLVSRINGKDWKDTIKYTLASAGIGTAIAALGEEELEEGPVWDKVKRTAAAGAVATGLGYAALTGTGADKAEQPPQQSTQPAVNVADKADKIATAQPQRAEEPKASTITKADPKMQGLLFNQAVKAGLRGEELAQFMAQTAHETLGFNELAELGSKDYFKQYDPRHNPDKAKSLGNVKPGDGERYKGRGFLQITGRENYRKAGQALGLPLEKRPELAERPDIAAKIAVWFWKSRVRPGIDDFSDTIGVTNKINPGMQGLGDRDANYHNYARVLKVATR